MAAVALGRGLPQQGDSLAYHPSIALAIGLVYWGTSFAAVALADSMGIALRLVFLHSLAGFAVVVAPFANVEVNLARQAEYVSFALLPFALVNFMASLNVLSAPQDARTPTRWQSHLLAVTALALLVLKALQLKLGLADDWLRRPLFANLAFGLVLGMVLAWQNFRASVTGPRDRLWVIALGAIAGVAPLTLLSILPQALIGRPLLPPELTVMATVLFPLSSVYVVLGRDRPEIDFLIGRSMVYGAMTTTLLTTYFAVMAVVCVFRRNRPPVPIQIVQ
ncbi:MAG: hypothetical protein ACYCSN_20985 [Acidobacteriaceae bacterium]